MLGMSRMRSAHSTLTRSELDPTRSTPSSDEHLWLEFEVRSLALESMRQLTCYNSVNHVQLDAALEESRNRAVWLRQQLASGPGNNRAAWDSASVALQIQVHIFMFQITT